MDAHAITERIATIKVWSIDEMRRRMRTLRKNMVVTMEPMIAIDGLGGFRHHDICRITGTGIENLNTFPRGVLLVDNGLKLQEVWLPD